VLTRCAGTEHDDVVVAAHAVIEAHGSDARAGRRLSQPPP
jgi:hypothetical protein